MSLEENIKKWVVLDNQLKLIADKSKELREEKNSISDNILTYVETNNLDNVTAKITGGKLKFVNTKQTAPLTLKFIEKCLNDCITNKDQVELLLNHIKEQRDVKYVKEIKRYFEKE
jgi:hypothetical protein